LNGLTAIITAGMITFHIGGFFDQQQLGVFDAFCFIKSEYWCSILDFALLFSKKV
jgi:hypothetical protein